MLYGSISSIREIGGPISEPYIRFNRQVGHWCWKNFQHGQEDNEEEMAYPGMGNSLAIRGCYTFRL
jgi:hypothetical protein